MRTRPSAVRAAKKAASQPVAVLRMASAVFLSDHEQAAASGEPLLTEKGIIYLHAHLTRLRGTQMPGPRGRGEAGGRGLCLSGSALPRMTWRGSYGLATCW